LTENRPDCFFKKPALIVRRRDDTYARPFSCLHKTLPVKHSPLRKVLIEEGTEVVHSNCVFAGEATGPKIKMDMT
jgi:hypothetical protein